MLNLYQWAEKTTSNFKKISPEIILKEPKVLKIFRVLSGNGQTTFAKTLGISQSAVSALERGAIKALSKKELKRVGLVLSKQKFEVLSEEEFIKRSKKIAIRGRFYSEYAKAIAEKNARKAAIRSAQSKKPTVQEQQIADFLQGNGICFEKQASLEVNNVFYVVDFVIPNAKNPRMIIEAKNLETKYRKKASICELAYRSIKLKQKYSGVKTVAVINGNLTKTEELILSQEFDTLLYNSPLNKLLFS
jgi:DNA-binding XRE family transcriptional regulator